MTIPGCEASARRRDPRSTCVPGRGAGTRLRRSRGALAAVPVLLLVCVAPAIGAVTGQRAPATRSNHPVTAAQAAEEIEQQLQKEPRNAKLHVLLGMAYMREGQGRRAL